MTLPLVEGSIPRPTRTRRVRRSSACRISCSWTAPRPRRVSRRGGRDRYSFLTADPALRRPQQGRTRRVHRPTHCDAHARCRRRPRRHPSTARPASVAAIPGLAAVPGRRGRLHRLRLGRRPRATPRAALRRPCDPRRGVRHLRLGHRLGSRHADAHGSSPPGCPRGRRARVQRAATAPGRDAAATRRNGTATRQPRRGPLGGSYGASRAPSYPVPMSVRPASIGLRSSFTHRGYLDAVTRVREYIVAGDIFQANLSQRFEAPLGESAWSLYRRLRTVNPAPFAAYLAFDDLHVLSASPERFLRLDDARRVETRPIKGTRPRGIASRTRRRARPGTDRERQGPGREPHDRGPAAQRSVACVRGRIGARARVVRA